VQLVCNLAELPLFDATDRIGRCERFCVGPAMQFTHWPLRWSDQRPEDLDYDTVIRPFETKRVVLLIRHPLDVLVSLWMQRRYRTSEPYEGELVDFLNEQIWGIEKYFRFYSLWFEHNDRVRDFLLIRYEDMRQDPSRVFSGLLSFLNVPVQEEYQRRAVRDSDFDAMKKVEMSGGGPRYRSSGNSIFASGDRSNPDALHVRRGEVGGYVNYLDAQDVEKLAVRIKSQLPAFFGYSSHLRQER
jgi:hypothetical protein